MGSKKQKTPPKSDHKWPAGHGASGDEICVAVGDNVRKGRIHSVGYANKYGTPCVVRATFDNGKTFEFLSVFETSVFVFPAFAPDKAIEFAKKHKLFIVLRCCNNEVPVYGFVNQDYCDVVFVAGTVETATLRFIDGKFSSGKPEVDEGFEELRIEGSDEKLCDTPEEFEHYS